MARTPHLKPRQHLLLHLPQLRIVTEAIGRLARRRLSTIGRVLKASRLHRRVQGIGRRTEVWRPVIGRRVVGRLGRHTARGRSAGLVLRSWVELVAGRVVVGVRLGRDCSGHGSVIGRLLHWVGLGRHRQARVVGRGRGVGRTGSVSVGLPSTAERELPSLPWKPRFELGYELRIKPGGQLIERLPVSRPRHFLNEGGYFVFTEAGRWGLPAPRLLRGCIRPLHHYFNRPAELGIQI